MVTGSLWPIPCKQDLPWNIQPQSCLFVKPTLLCFRTVVAYGQASQFWEDFHNGSRAQFIPLLSPRTSPGLQGIKNPCEHSSSRARAEFCKAHFHPIFYETKNESFRSTTYSKPLSLLMGLHCHHSFGLEGTGSTQRFSVSTGTSTARPVRYSILTGSDFPRSSAPRRLRRLMLTLHHSLPKSDYKQGIFAVSVFLFPASNILCLIQLLSIKCILKA